MLPSTATEGVPQGPSFACHSSSCIPSPAHSPTEEYPMAERNAFHARTSASQIAVAVPVGGRANAQFRSDAVRSAVRSRLAEADTNLGEEAHG
jgi:hypothetical protein